MRLFARKSFALKTKMKELISLTKLSKGSLAVIFSYSSPFHSYRPKGGKAVIAIHPLLANVVAPNLGRCYSKPQLV